LPHLLGIIKGNLGNRKQAFWKLFDEKYPNWQKVKEKLELKFGGY